MTDSKAPTTNAAKRLMDWVRLNPGKALALCDAADTITYLLTNNDTVEKNDLSVDELIALIDVANLKA